MNVQLKISKRRTIVFVGMFLLLFVTLFDNTVFALAVSQGMVIILISGLLFTTQLRKKILQINWFVALFTIGFIFVLVNNYEFKHQNYIYELTFTVLIVIIYSAQRTFSIWYDFFFKILFLFGLICSIVTYASYFVPEIYTSVILPNAQDVYYNSLVYCFRMGYQPGIATHYSSNGMYLAIFSGCAFSMYVSQNKKTGKYIILTILAMVSLLLTAKRAHVLFGIGAMLVVYYMKNADHKSTRLVKMLAIIILALVLFVIIGQFIPAINGFIERFLEAEESGDILNNRSTLYAYAILLFSQNPLWGNGWGSYKYLRESVFGEYNNAHNVFLQLLAETGVIGTVIFTSIIISMLIVTVKTFHKMCVNRENYSRTVYRSCAFAVYMQVFFFLYCFTGNPLYDRIIWIPTVLSAVVSFYVGRSQSIVRK